MNLLKTSFFSAIIAFIRVGTGFVAGKAIAILTGPAGVALIGAFSNFITVVLTFANGAINTGVVKYTAEYEKDEENLKSLFSTSFRISVYCSGFIGVVLFLFGTLFSKWIFVTKLYGNPIRVLGVTIILYSLNSLMISILNGKKEIKKYTLVNTVGSIIGLIFTLILVYYFKLEGALYALVLSQSIVFFITLFLITKSDWFSWKYFKLGFNKVIALKLSHYSLMAIVSAVTIPVSQILLRNIIIKNLGVDSAGFWQGMMRISDGYLMIITTSLSTYYLPKLSSIKEEYEIKSEVFKSFKIIMPLVVLGCIIIYFLRFVIISVLFTKNFMAMQALFFWQLLGDFFKIASWILGYIMIAKSMTKYFLITEIFFSTNYVFFGWLFMKYYNVEGVAMAFALNYLLCLFFMIYIFRKLLFQRNKQINSS
ncbi:multidrug transporter MatE [Flavobacterium sp. Root901]|uniref:O-antigen translocase n=1 Tax=Flavobacterium sp. Root901 TaxID=1736605 RepID=UPI00070EB7B5|nr:O-antigen translocase [Flavobacterium sp. Root901]KRD07489.1 multidrug transporter MatE [Flavobacterium sp. Root901]